MNEGVGMDRGKKKVKERKMRKDERVDGMSSSSSEGRRSTNEFFVG